ncbi:MAG TPA: aldolase, partial [Beijerinckiaceae bacterium]|nr:aldolase [Beijerinckiaceae bacterium]
MALPRLNGIIRALESGQCAFSLFAPPNIETAVELQASKYDGVIFEGEHRPWDIQALRDAMQYLLNRGQIAKAGSVAASVTPTARIPANGVEK